MRLLVVGGTGMLGHKLLQSWVKKYPETYATVRADMSEEPFCRVPFLQTEKVCGSVDALDTPRLRDVILRLKPDCILNCVGIIKQHKENAAPLPCIKINSLLPHELVAIAAEYGGRVIHFSTDCVFDGKRGSYSEEDAPDATDVYGRSKAMESSVMRMPDAANLDHRKRVEDPRFPVGLVSPAAGGRIKGFTRAIYSGVTTNQMAKVVAMILERYPTLSGLYQIVADPISKYDLLILARENSASMSRSSRTMDSCSTGA